MLELLGVGIPRRTGGWLVRDVSARIEGPALVAVTGGGAEQRQALLDAITGRIVPVEGRVWLGGVPIVRGRRSLVRRLVADIDAQSLVRRANDPRRRLTPSERLVVDVARSVGSGVECVVIRELDAVLNGAEAAATAALLKIVAGAARLMIVVGAREGTWPARAAVRLIDLSAPAPARLGVS